MTKGRRTEYDLNAMLDAPKAQESFALIGLIRDDNPKIMDDEYTESIIVQLRQLGSGEIFIDFALDHLDTARSDAARRPAISGEVPLATEVPGMFDALCELTPVNLARNHVIHCGCVSLGDPCMYNNGPCCCEAGWNIGSCPFRQGHLRLDDDFVAEQLAKLKFANDIKLANNNISRARVLIKQMEEEINSSTC